MYSPRVCLNETSLVLCLSLRPNRSEDAIEEWEGAVRPLSFDRATPRIEGAVRFELLAVPPQARRE
jgi:hypothetical protein